MDAGMRPAIDREVLDRPLGEINAAEFLGVLHQAQLSADVMALLPDKKKYELWVDEGGTAKIPVGVLFERLRREKKKVELEKRLIVENFPKRRAEFEMRPEDFIDPAVREQIVEQIVAEVQRRVGR